MPVLARMQPTSGNKFEPTKLLAALLFSPVFPSALMMTHTPAHPTEISSHAPQRERKSEIGRKSQKEEYIQYVRAEKQRNTRFCVLICLLCLLKYLRSSAFLLAPCRAEMRLVFLHR